MQTSQIIEKKKIKQLEKDIMVDKKNIDGMINIIQKSQSPSAREEITQTETSESIRFFAYLFIFTKIVIIYIFIYLINFKK